MSYQPSTRDSIPYLFSNIFERASYYGFRSLLIIYMVSETLQMETEEALEIYSSLILLFTASRVLGALLGDLLIGNKASSIIGGAIQSMGAFSLCISGETGLYIGLGLIVLGNGLYYPNMTANFGRIYYNNLKRLDGAFTLLYLLINVGAFLGPLLVGALQEKWGWNAGFVLSGIFMLISTGLLPLVNTKPMSKGDSYEKPEGLIISPLKVLAAVLLFGVFWGASEIFYSNSFQLSTNFYELFSDSGIPQTIWASLSTFLILPFLILATILWLYFSIRPSLKLFFGFLLGGLSLLAMVLIPEIPQKEHLLLFLFATLTIGIAEVLINPILNAVVVRYSHPKYLAIFLSLAYVPIQLISSLSITTYQLVEENTKLSIVILIVFMEFIAAGIFIYWLISRKRPKTVTAQD